MQNPYLMEMLAAEHRALRFAEAERQRRLALIPARERSGRAAWRRLGATLATLAMAVLWRNGASAQSMGPTGETHA